MSTHTVRVIRNLTEVTNKIADLIRKAPAGGVFHGATVNLPGDEQWTGERRILVVTPAGQRYMVTVRELAPRLVGDLDKVKRRLADKP